MICLLPLLGLAAEANGLCVSVKIPYEKIHGKYGKGYSLGITAEISYEHGKKTASHTVNESAVGCGGRGDVIRRHKECSEEETSREELREHKGHGMGGDGEEIRQHRYGKYIGNGYMPGDGTARKKVYASRKY